MLFNKIKSHKTFLLEILAVFIGITASFWVDDYRTNLQEQNIASKYLAGFIEDFQEDKAQLDLLIDTRYKQLASSEALLESIESNTLDVDAFYHHFYVIFPFHRFIPNSNTIEEVLNASNLRLIQDEEIKNRILELRNQYSSIQLSEEHVYHDRIAYLYSKYVLANIEFNGLELSGNDGSFSSSRDAAIYRRDAENFQKDRQFKSFLNLLKYNLKFLIPKTEEIRDECESIIALIKKDRVASNGVPEE